MWMPWHSCCKAHDTFAEAGIECELIEREGKPAFVIGDVADEIEADLIVMGTRGINLEQAAVLQRG